MGVTLPAARRLWGYLAVYSYYAGEAKMFPQNLIYARLIWQSAYELRHFTTKRCLGKQGYDLGSGVITFSLSGE